MSESDFRSEDAREEAEVSAAADEQVTEGNQITDDALQRAEGLTVDPDVRKNYQEAAERGANVQGEGAIP